MIDYKKDLEIDKYALDEECLKQPQLCRKYSKLKVEARKKLDKANEKLKTIRSELILKAKRGGEELLGCKVTDPVVEAYYRTQKEYKEAKEEVIKAEFEFNILDDAYSNFSYQRKTGVEGLIQLHLNDYYSNVREPKNSNVKEKAIKKATNKQRERLNRRKKNG